MDARKSRNTRNLRRKARAPRKTRGATNRNSIRIVIGDQYLGQTRDRLQPSQRTNTQTITPHINASTYDYLYQRANNQSIYQTAITQATKNQSDYINALNARQLKQETTVDRAKEAIEEQRKLLDRLRLEAPVAPQPVVMDRPMAQDLSFADIDAIERFGGSQRSISMASLEPPVMRQRGQEYDIDPTWNPPVEPPIVKRGRGRPRKVRDPNLSIDPLME
jgi:hypothetical protein